MTAPSTPHTPSVEMLREVSASEIARLIGRSHHYVVGQLEKIPAAYRTEGGHWKCPLWAWQKHQAEGDRR